MLRAVLAAAVDQEQLAGNVAAGVRPAGRPAKEVMPPNAKQVEALFDHARTPEAHAVFTLAASLGLRRGVIFGLTWAGVDFERSVVRVETSNYNGTVGAPKTRAGRREVPMFASARRVLLEHRMRATRKGPDDLVFANVLGGPEHPVHYVRRELKAALEAAGLPERAFTFHSLRHHAVSRLIEQGANILQVARVAGHADPSVTLRVYSHLMSDGLAQAARTFDPLGAREAVANV